MLSLALILLIGPVDERATGPFPPSTVDVQVGEGGDVRRGAVAVDAAMDRFLSGRCEPILRYVSPPPSTGVVRPLSTFDAAAPVAEPRVRMYHLLERTIDGCRVPVIAIDHLPEADQAIGRTFGGPVIPR